MNRANNQHWEKILGKELYEKIQENPEDNLITAEDSCKEAEDFCRKFMALDTLTVPDSYEVIRKETFGPLYQNLIAAYMEDKRPEKDWGILLKNPMQMTAGILLEGIRELPLRVCISDMHSWKQQGRLWGKSTAEEYACYCSNRLGEFSQVQQLCREYPELLRLIGVRLVYSWQNWSELLNRLQKDREELTYTVCWGKPFHFIRPLDLDGADRHHDGNRVMKLGLDNGMEIIYKPHTLEKEIIYRDLYGGLCKELELENMTYELLDKGHYGWEEYLHPKDCVSEEQVRKYYFRMGIHLFLCMLFNTSDMHQENILAVGEYPVALDLETFPGIRKKKGVKDATERIRYGIDGSVLNTGILPVFVWKNQDRAVTFSALNRESGGMTSIKLPVIEGAGTSEMRIAYRQLPVKQGRSMPYLNRQKTDPGKYTEQLCAGFAGAYRSFMGTGEKLEKIIGRLWNCQTRFLIRHTQQYSMYLFSSLHPELMKDRTARMMILQVLQKGDSERRLVKQEIKEMLQMDIPHFEWPSGAICPYFECSAREGYEEKRKELGEKDLQNQLGLIHLSMEIAVPENQQNSYFAKDERLEKQQKKKVANKADIESALKKVLGKIVSAAVLHNGDVNWATLDMERGQFWRMEPAGLDLYDGIGGIAIFLSLMKTAGLLENGEIYERTIRKLFAHTNLKQQGETRRGGLMLGEGSIAYVYLLLFRMTGESQFWEYARKQVDKIGLMEKGEGAYDLMYGEAGYIWLLSEMYRESGEELYLYKAVSAGDALWGRAVRQKNGYGWESGGTKALSGMAHGNSGIMTAYGNLWNFTHNRKYKKIIDELLLYESSLYSSRGKNWRDMRYPCQEAYSNAWCHGAAGILLTRLELLSLEEYQENAVIQKDIENASRILFAQSERKGMCLCHGRAGNLWIMNRYRGMFAVSEGQKEIMERLSGSIVEDILEWESMLPQDKYTPGLMTGLSGIGCILYDLYESKLSIR